MSSSSWTARSASSSCGSASTKRRPASSSAARMSSALRGSSSRVRHADPDSAPAHGAGERRSRDRHRERHGLPREAVLGGDVDGEVRGRRASGGGEHAEDGHLAMALVLDDVHLPRTEPERRTCSEWPTSALEVQSSRAFGNPDDLVVQVVMPRRLARRDESGKEVARVHPSCGPNRSWKERAPVAGACRRRRARRSARGRPWVRGGRSPGRPSRDRLDSPTSPRASRLARENEPCGGNGQLVARAARASAPEPSKAWRSWSPPVSVSASSSPGLMRTRSRASAEPATGGRSWDHVRAAGVPVATRGVVELAVASERRGRRAVSDPAHGCVHGGLSCASDALVRRATPGVARTARTSSLAERSPHSSFGTRTSAPRIWWSRSAREPAS